MRMKLARKIPKNNPRRGSSFCAQRIILLNRSARRFYHSHSTHLLRFPRFYLSRFVVVFLLLLLSSSADKRSPHSEIPQSNARILLLCQHYPLYCFLANGAGSSASTVLPRKTSRKDSITSPTSYTFLLLHFDCTAAPLSLFLWLIALLIVDLCHMLATRAFQGS